MSDAETSTVVRTPDDRLIVALDLPDSERAIAMADRLDESVSVYKLGLGLLASNGLSLVGVLHRRKKRVFLDLKLFDIGATVERAVAGIAGLGPELLTVHGDPHVVEAALTGVRQAGSETRILAVTLLTSVDRNDLDRCLIREGPVDRLVLERARRAFEAGADGVVASASEAAMIRSLPTARGKLVVTPGIRLAGASTDDQKRVATPAAAFQAGASHIVVGRPIIQAPDPLAAVGQVLDSIAGR